MKPSRMTPLLLPRHLDQAATCLHSTFAYLRSLCADWYLASSYRPRRGIIDLFLFNHYYVEHFIIVGIMQLIITRVAENEPAPPGG